MKTEKKCHQVPLRNHLKNNITCIYQPTLRLKQNFRIALYQRKDSSEFSFTVYKLFSIKSDVIRSGKTNYDSILKQ